MKFIDKLKEILKNNPDIQRRRAIINAMYYVSKHDPKISVAISHNEPLRVLLYTNKKIRHHCEVRYIEKPVILKPFSDYSS